MYQIDPLSRIPIYEQLVEQTEKLILSGALKPMDRLPSVRSLSLELSVNPNTIQKAYTELERRGFTASAPGRGSYVAGGADASIQAWQEERLSKLRSDLQELHRAGVPGETVLNVWKEVYGAR